MEIDEFECSGSLKRIGNSLVPLFPLTPVLSPGYHWIYSPPFQQTTLALRSIQPDRPSFGLRYNRNIEHAVIHDAERIVHDRKYHTIYESKNGLGPAPIKTPEGWLQLAHGVRNTAAGLRYVLYCFLCELDQPWKVIAKPGGYFLAPRGEERVGDVSNVAFSNGWVQRGEQILIYYGASDTRTYVAETTVDRLLDYVINTPPDPLRSAACVQQRIALIERNLRLPGGGRR